MRTLNGLSSGESINRDGDNFDRAEYFDGSGGNSGDREDHTGDREVYTPDSRDYTDDRDVHTSNRAGYTRRRRDYTGDRDAYTDDRDGYTDGREAYRALRFVIIIEVPPGKSSALTCHCNGRISWHVRQNNSVTHKVLGARR